MKKTTLKFPMKSVEFDRNVRSAVHDFLVDCVIDGDLILDAQGFMTLVIGEHDIVGEYEDDDGMYDIYEVEVEGDDFSIDQIDTWQKQFEQELH